MSSWEIALNFLDYSLITLYGFLLCTALCGGFHSRKEKRELTIVLLLVILLQTASAVTLGLETTFKIYPLICHMPIIFVLHFSQKHPWKLSIVALLTAYFCCQIPRFFAKLGEWVFQTHAAYQIVYPLAIIATYILLRCYFCRVVNNAMTYSRRSLLIFSAVPAFYYLFDYATTVYTSALYSGIKALSEFMPVVLALFYVVFITLYHEETQRLSEAELQNSMMEMSIKQSESEITALLSAQEKGAIYRHDMRHHLTMLTGFLADGRTADALSYLGEVQEEIQRITPKRYCENSSVNVLLSAFAEKASACGIRLSSDITIPKQLAIPNMEFCSLLSNALENAIRAVNGVSAEKEITLSCRIKRDKLLLCITNPYSGAVTMANGIPVSDKPGHGFGVKSIQSIVSRHHGMCIFTAEDGIFVLRVVLPLP